MKKSIISLVGLTALLSLTGCTTGNASSKVKVAPTSFRLTTEACSLIVGQEYEIKTGRITPFEAYDADFTFTSSDASVAKVSKKGVVTGVGAGDCVITVASKLNPELKRELPVYVLGKISSSNAKTRASELKESQVTNHAEAQKLICNQYVVINKTANGEDYKYEDFSQNYLADQTEGVFNIDLYSEEKNTHGGSRFFSNFGYYFLTNAGYDSWIYKYDGDDTRNKFYLRTEDFIDKGYSRFGVVELMLDSFFSSGRKIITNQLANALEQDLLDDITGEGDESASSFSFGSKSSVNIQAAGFNPSTRDFIVKTGSSGTYSIAADQESSWGIPAGTSFTYKEQIVTHWRGDYVRDEDIYIRMAYTLNKVKYVEEEFITYSIRVNDDVSYSKPNPTDYERVWDLSDL